MKVQKIIEVSQDSSQDAAPSDDSNSKSCDKCRKIISNQFYSTAIMGIRVMIMRKNNYFNATQLCLRADKKFKHWMQNTGNQELIEYVARAAKIPVAKMYKRITDNTMLENGTYVHAKLLMAVAIWANPAYYCNFETAICGMSQSQASTQGFAQASAKCDEYMLIIYKNNHRTASKWQYTCLRVMCANSAACMRKHLCKHPRATQIMQIKSTPNAIQLWKLFKQRHGHRLYYEGSNFDLRKKYSIVKLKRDMHSTHEFYCENVSSL